MSIDNFPQNPNVMPIVRVTEDGVFANSRDVAAYFHKRHDDVLRKYDGLECSPEFNARNFAAVEYVDAKGETRRSIDMTRDGFTFIAMGFTGKRAAKFKEGYIAAYNEMEDRLRGRTQIALSPAQGELALAIETNDSLSNIERHLHAIHTGLGAKVDAIAGAVIGSIIKHVARPILDRLEENQRWNEIRFKAAYDRDRLLIQSLAAKQDAEECVSIAVAQTMMGVEPSARSSRLSRNLSANALHWFLARGYTARPDTAHAKGPMVFQRSKIAEWWADAGRAIYERELHSKSAPVIPLRSFRGAGK